MAFFGDTYNPIKKCVGPDSNRRTPARRDPKSRSFDLTRIPTPCIMALPVSIREVQTTTLSMQENSRMSIYWCGENMSVSSDSGAGYFGLP